MATVLLLPRVAWSRKKTVMLITTVMPNSAAAMITRDEAIVHAEPMTMFEVARDANKLDVKRAVEKLLGPARKARFDVILAGDVVARKKPDPEIYTLVLQRLGRPEEFAAFVRHAIENPMLNGAVLRLDGAVRLAAK